MLTNEGGDVVRHDLPAELRRIEDDNFQSVRGMADAFRMKKQRVRAAQAFGKRRARQTEMAVQLG